MAVLSAVGAKVWLLHLKSVGGAVGSLSLNVIREVCSYFPACLSLVWVTDNSISFFNFSFLTMNPSVPLERSIQANTDSSWVAIDSTRVLVCGGYQSKQLNSVWGALEYCVSRASNWES